MNLSEIRKSGPARDPQCGRGSGEGDAGQPHIRAGIQVRSRHAAFAALSRMFKVVLDQYRRKGLVWGAYKKSALVGVCALLEPGRCQATLAEKLRVARTLLAGGDLGLIARALQWQSGWNRHDPKTAHWHLGPVAVEPRLQGKGIGTALLQQFCEKMDAERASAYLEADKTVNVTFYERFGFEVIAEDAPLGVPGWFMWRNAPSDTGGHR